MSIIIANVLGPEEYGILGYVMIFLTYAGWITFSAMSSSFREMPALIKNKKITEAVYKQNIGFTIDAITSLIVFATLLIISILHKDLIYRNLLFLVSILYLISTIRSFLGTINFTYFRYNLAAKAAAISAVISPLLLVLFIYYFGVYTPPLVSIIVTFIIVIYLFTKERYSLRFLFNKKESIKAAIVGFQLNFNTILQNLFRHKADMTIIAMYFTKTELGIYLFAFKIYDIIFRVVDDYSRVLGPKIFAAAESLDSTIKSFFPLREMAIIFSIVSSIVICLSQLGFIGLVNYLAPKYIESQWIFIILISYLFWSAQVLFPNYILISAKVNRQNAVNILWSIALAINIILDIIVIKLGYGIIGIAFVTVLSEIFFSISEYFLASRYMFNDKRNFFYFLMKLLIPFIITVSISIIHFITINNYPIHLFILLSLILQLLFWPLFLYIFYRSYFNNFFLLLKSLRTKLIK